jgi:hypothetical protein
MLSGDHGTFDVLVLWLATLTGSEGLRLSRGWERESGSLKVG